MKTIDLKFMELCDEIDYWKEQTEKYKKLYDEQVRESITESHRRLAESQKGVTQALLLTMSVTDNPDGSLSISKENRKQLAKTFKSDQ